MGNRQAVFLLFISLCAACATSFDARGIFHRVRKGESLPWIAKSYGVDLQDVAELNNIQNANQKLNPGQKLYIPEKRANRYKQLPFEGKIASHVRHPSLGAEGVGSVKSREDTTRVLTEHGRFLWPVDGKVLSPFGVRNGRRHDGIDIKSPTGTPIKVADAGKVVYAGSMRGYGNLVLVRHRGDFFTAYSHNKTNRVKTGEKVVREQIIGTVGQTGRATGPHLHFEVREGERARNPLFFLPVK